MRTVLGAVAEVPELSRALVEVEWFEADEPDFADTTRCGIFEDGDEGWRLIAVRYLAVPRSLLVGLAFSEEQHTNDPTAGTSGITAGSQDG